MIAKKFLKRSKLNFIIDCTAFVAFVLLCTTGILMRYVLPPGSGRSSTIWNLDRHGWGGIHFWISIIFFSILALHLVLHWRWIVALVTGRTKNGSGFRAGLGVLGFVLVIFMCCLPLLSPVETNSAPKEPSLISSHKYEDISIRGSMTLIEVETITEVPANYIIAALHLPESTSSDERLGRLKRAYGFKINDVKEIIKLYKE